MENVLNQLTPLQTLFVLGLHAWIFVIFPLLVLKKLNYMTDLLESQFEDENQEQ